MEADAGISVKRRVRTAASLEALLNSCKTRRLNVRAWLVPAQESHLTWPSKFRRSHNGAKRRHSRWATTTTRLESRLYVVQIPY